MNREKYSMGIKQGAPRPIKESPLRGDRPLSRRHMPALRAFLQTPARARASKRL